MFTKPANSSLWGSAIGYKYQKVRYSDDGGHSSESLRVCDTGVVWVFGNLFESWESELGCLSRAWVNESARARTSPAGHMNSCIYAEI